jgi:hypothetical protein
MTEGRLIPNTRWTPEEDAWLGRLAKDGRGAPVIAERLKRSQGAVYNRARKLGVTLKRAAAEGKGEMK